MNISIHTLTSMIRRVKWSVVITALVFSFCCEFTAISAADGHAAVKAAMDSDGRTFTVTAQFLTGFRAGWSATVEIDGKKQKLSSDAGMVVVPVTHSTEATPYGAAEVIRSWHGLQSIQ